MTDPASPAPAERLPALDAVRAFALLAGVVLHSTLAWVMPPGQWGVGADRPDLVLWAFTHYVHDFRMQLFFLLAGFFGALVVSRRGIRGYVRDRAVRIGLVFVVFVYPLKVLVSIPWIAGGLSTGWLELPPKIARLPLLELAIGSLFEERWPAISPAHLWFLYYLLLVTGLFLVLRWAWARRPLPGAPAGPSRVSAALAVLAARPLGPIVLSVPLALLLRLTPGGVLASPDKGFVPEWPALAVFGSCFVFGWWLFRQRELLDAFARWWPGWIGASLAATAGAFVLELQLRTVGLDPAGLWLAAVANALVLTFATLGWTGLFVARCSAPSPAVRYLADASYWIYLVHLPVVVATQVWVADWTFRPAQLLVVNLVTFAVSLASYHWLVRDTPLGQWLNGRRHPRRRAGSAGSPPAVLP